MVFCIWIAGGAQHNRRCRQGMLGVCAGNATYEWIHDRSKKAHAAPDAAVFAALANHCGELPSLKLV
jgi:hypothetical protein